MGLGGSAGGGELGGVEAMGMQVWLVSFHFSFGKLDLVFGLRR